MNTLTQKTEKLMQDAVLYNFSEMTEVFDVFTSNEDNVRKITEAAAIMIESLNAGGKILACGNGGSMCDASHFCEELLARFRNNRKALPAIAISDSSYITCVANDFNFNTIFSRLVEAIGCPGDVLLGISTSGNSENVVQAAMVAREKGIKVIVLTGKSNGVLGDYSDIEISAPPTKFSDRAQEIHIKVIHTLVQLIEFGLGLDE